MPVIVVLAEAGLVWQPLASIWHVAASATGVIPTDCAFCDAASPQDRDIMDVIDVLPAPSPELPIPVALPEVEVPPSKVEVPLSVEAAPPVGVLASSAVAPTGIEKAGNPRVYA